MEGAWVSVCIDDVIALDDEEESNGEAAGDGEEVFQAALQVYAKHGLAPKEEKVVRGATSGKALGGLLG